MWKQQRNYVPNVKRGPSIPAQAQLCISNKAMLPSSALSPLLPGKAPIPDASLGLGALLRLTSKATSGPVQNSRQRLHSLPHIHDDAAAVAQLKQATRSGVSASLPDHAPWRIINWSFTATSKCFMLRPCKNATPFWRFIQSVSSIKGKYKIFP